MEVMGIKVFLQWELFPPVVFLMMDVFRRRDKDRVQKLDDDTTSTRDEEDKRLYQNQSSTTPRKLSTASRTLPNTVPDPAKPEFQSHKSKPPQYFMAPRLSFWIALLLKELSPMKH